MNEHGAIPAYGTVIPSQGMNQRRPYDHQQQAMHSLDLLDAEGGPFSTMVVLPTGGGKTYTASNWLLHNAIGKHKKVLWIAHRHMLLDQAAESFKKYAFASMMPDAASFSYRIISGLPAHHNAARISKTDDLIIASKDSLHTKFDKLEEWLSGQQEMFLVVDEAHHATAKTYRNLIQKLKGIVPVVKIIGLTATPFRTLDAEKGLLSKIFTDGIVDGKPVHGESGIAYQIGLQDLINKQILSRPLIETCETDEEYGQDLAASEIEHMQRFDSIPDKIAKQMVASKTRNKLIVERYANNQAEYGQTILFAVNIAHAVTLQKLFADAGISSDIVVSQLRDDDTGRMRSRAENQQAIKDYADGKIKVLINVNILTEGVDLPKTRSVFLARPTSSTILMTQMIGRGLRGEKAGGTAESHIVSFVDGWDERVAWTSPETLFSGNNQFNDEDRKERERADLRAISISKIREFANILDSTVDTTLLEGIPFIERIPIGMYVFTYTEQGDEENNIEGSDVSCQVMVYSSTQSAYEAFVESLPNLVKGKGLEDADFAPQVVLDDMVRTAEKQFFFANMVPPYRKNDLVSILKYYVQFEAAPIFYTFDSIDREKLDVSSIAREIVDQDMGPLTKKEYEDQLWSEGDDNILRMFFGNVRNFKHAVQYEVDKLTDPDLYCTATHIAAPEEVESPISATGSSLTANAQTVDEAVPNREVAATARASSTASTASAVSAPQLNDAMKTQLADMDCTSYSLDVLMPSESVLSSLDAYIPHGFAKHPITGLPLKKFGKNAKIVTVGQVSSLYSRGRLVAQTELGKRARLLSCNVKGSVRSWSDDKQTLLHVGDLLAHIFTLTDAPTLDQIRKMAQDQQVDLSIHVVDVADEEEAKTALEEKFAVGVSIKPGSKATQTHEGGKKADNGCDMQSGQTEPAPVSNHSSQLAHQIAETAKLAEPTNCKSDALETAGGKPQVAYYKSNEDYGLLPYAPITGYTRITKKNETGKLNLNARIEKTDNAKLLYSNQLLVARYSESDGLTLYEYGHGENVTGWFDRAYNDDVRDFAVRELKRKSSVSTNFLREKAHEAGSGVTTVRVGEVPDGLAQDAERKKNQASQPAEATHASGPEDSADHAATGTGSAYLHVFPANLRSRSNTARRTITYQSVIAITQAGQEGCNVFTKDGKQYVLRKPFGLSANEFARNGLMVAELGCMIRPESVTSIVNPAKPRVRLCGYTREFPIGQEALKALRFKCSDLKTSQR